MLVVALTAGGSGAASAHANYMTSDPAPNARLAAPPARISVTFSEAYDPKASTLTLLRSDGTTVAATLAATDRTVLTLTPPALPQGAYAVAWSTVSAVDGDPAHGYFGFAIGDDPPWSGAIDASGTDNGASLRLHIEPGRVGANAYLATPLDGSGRPLANVTRIRLRVQPLDKDLGIATGDLAAAGDTFGGTGIELAFAGRFQVGVEVRRRDILNDLKYAFTVTVPTPQQTTVVATAAPAGGASATSAPAEGPGAPSWLPLAAGAAALAILGAAVLLGQRRAR